MEHIIHLPEFRVVVCKKCQYVVLPNEIESHFTQEQPHGFTREARREITAVVSRIHGLITTEVIKHGGFTFPSDTAGPVAELAKPLMNGLRCTFVIEDGSECPFVSKTVRRMQEHCNHVHGWQNTQGKGRPRESSVSEAPKVPWRSGVQYQRFFKQGPGSRFFEVRRARESEADNGVAVPKSAWERLREKISEGCQKVEEATQRRIEATDESREPNPWLRRTGWARHLGGYDRVKLRDLVRPVDEHDDTELVIIHQAFHRLIRAAQKVAVTDIVGQAALFEAHRKEVNKKPPKPFNSRMDKTTFKQYTSVWEKLLSYVWRTDGLEEKDKPPFKFSHRQQLEFEQLVHAAEKVSQVRASQTQEVGSQAENHAEEEVEKQVLQLCIALLDHRLGDHQYQSVIISGLAVLGLEEGGRWADAEDYTPKLSAVIKLARLMVVRKAYESRQVSIKRKKARGMSQVHAEEDAPSHVELVQEMMQKFMMSITGSGQPSPMDWMLDTRTYGLHIRYSNPVEGTIGWQGDTILYQEIKFNMQQVRSMVHGLVADTRRMLIQDLLMLEIDEHGDVQGVPLPAIDWASIVDNPTEKKVGWSFLQDIRNPFQVKVPGADWLARRVVEEPMLKRRYIKEEGEIQWRRGAVTGFRHKVEQFQEKLLILMHFTGGQAARAPEIISIRHRNTTNGGVRNIFIDQGLVLFVTAYHKGYEFSERTKIIQRFLPKEVGELLVYYLWLVLPFSEAIDMVVDGVDELSAFIWGDDRNKDDDEADDQDPGEEAADGADAVVEAHESPDPKRRSRPWTSERMRKIIQRESVAWMGVRLNISAWRQVVIAIARKFLIDKYGFEDESSDGFEDFDEDNPEGDSAWDLQSGHGTRMAGMIYARLLSEGGFETKAQKDRYRKVSQEWHQFLGFESSRAGFGVRIGQKRPRQHWEEVNREMQQLRHKQLRRVNMQAQLEVLLGADSQFRGLQRPAINAIMQGHSPIMVIMGTGGGKSMMFMLPAGSVSGGTTVVVVPLVALQGDLEERCNRARISSLIWSSKRPYESASIIFVTPESAMSRTFAGFINRLQEMHQLDRIVIDECHTILDGSPKFRPKLQKLGELVLIGAQMIYLTATLPPREEGRFCKLMHINQQEWKLFRGRTTRTNVRYQVCEVDVPDVKDVLGLGVERTGFEPVIHDAVVQLVQQKLEEYPAPAKIIIYSSIIKGAEGLGEVIGCEVYHRDIDCQDGKARRLDDWRNARNNGSPGQGRVIIATNALGLGVDVPDIRVVIHVGRIWALKDYAQESGRAGRDGKKSEAIIIRATGVGGDDYQQRPASGQIDIHEFIKGQQCRREILDAVMDAARVRDGCESGEEACDVCQAQRHSDPFEDSGFSSSQAGNQFPCSSPPRDITVEDEAELEEQQQQISQRDWTRWRVIKQRCQEGTEVKELVEYFEAWDQQCPLCRCRREPDPWHRIDECERDEAQDIMVLARHISQGVRYERFSGCFHCGVPQSICIRWKQIEDQGWWEEDQSRSCQYSGLLARAVATMLQEGEDDAVEDTYQWMQAEGVDVCDAKEVYQWFGNRVEWGGIEANRLVQVFYRLASQHQGRC